MIATPRINPNFFLPDRASFEPMPAPEVAPDLMSWADLFYPDKSLPDSVREAMAEAVDSRHGAHYTLPFGEAGLRAALAEKIRIKNGLDVNPERNIVVTPGSDAGLFFAMMPFLVPGDEVLVPDPSYISNQVNVRMLGGVPVPVDLVAGDSYRLDADAFRARVTDRTRMIILTHPNNPTTTVFTRSDLEALAALIVEKNLILIVDQAFEDHIFGDAEFVSPATLTGLWDRTVSVFSVSKGYGLSGLRIGYLVSNDAFTKVYNQYAVNVLGAPSTLSQIGAKAAIDDEEILARTFDQLDRRRRAVTELFASVPGVRLSPIESGFFAWLDVSALGTGREIEDYVLEHANVAITDGSMFGVHGTGFVRVIYGAYAADDKAMQICARIASCLIELAREKGISEDAA